MRKSANPTCSIVGCDRPTKARSWCALHYRRAMKTGDPMMTLSPAANRIYTSRPDADKFWEKVEKTDSCWLWTGALADTGYGSFGVRLGRNESKTMSAHRWAYEALVGPIPDGLHIDHLCRVRNCVNPRHLEPVTNRENARRGVAARLGDECRNGHERTSENTYIRKGGYVECRVCHREREAERKRAAA